ncbi:hypothetical protein X946_352 [Burkholderia sp. ABCPW 111]|nr:hypothetical protein X946_352 [Burkholderia sp. ABCPW 111]
MKTSFRNGAYPDIALSLQKNEVKCNEQARDDSTGTEISRRGWSGDRAARQTAGYTRYGRSVIRRPCRYGNTEAEISTRCRHSARCDRRHRRCLGQKHTERSNRRPESRLHRRIACDRTRARSRHMVDRTGFRARACGTGTPGDSRHAVHVREVSGYSCVRPPEAPRNIPPPPHATNPRAPHFLTPQHNCGTLARRRLSSGCAGRRRSPAIASRDAVAMRTYSKGRSRLDGSRRPPDRPSPALPPSRTAPHRGGFAHGAG